MNDILKTKLTLLRSPKILVLVGFLGIALIFLSSLSSKEEKKKIPVSAFL